LKDHNKTAIVWKAQHITYNITYKDLIRSVNHYAGLFDNTVDKIAIFAENRPEWAYAFYAGWQNRGISVPIDYLSSADELAYILNDCRPEVVFCSETTKKVLDSAGELIQYAPKIIIFESIQSPAEDIAIREFPTPDVNETAVIIYTSGTTGEPKGVMLSYDNLLANIEAVTENGIVFTPDRNVLVMLPLHHIFPLLGTLIVSFYIGTTTAFCPSLSSQDVIETLQNNQIAVIIGVPRFYNLIRKGIMDKINKKFITRALFKLARSINNMGFSRALFKTVHKKFGGHVMFLVCGGAKIDEEVAGDFKTLGFEMLEGFGMTEAAPMITFTRPGRVKVGSAGEAMPTLEVKAKDGEIIAKGRNIMKGYYNKKAETDAVLKDGWLHTGDLGYLDEKGFIHITGRKKELIVLPNGKNIGPEEIENKVSLMSDLISEIGVFLKGDHLQAAIYPDFKKVKEQNITNLAETIRWEVIDKFNQKVSPYKKINRFILLKEELPKTRLGKIQRFKLTELESAIATKKQETEEPSFKEYLVIKEFLVQQTEGEVFPDDHFEIDLGMDSLDKVSLQAFLNTTFGVETGDDIFIQYPTLEKLANFIRDKKVKMSVSAVKWAEIFKEKIDVQLPKSAFTQNLLLKMSKGLIKIYFRLKSEGLENLPKGPFIIAPNHQSYFDGLFVAAFLKSNIMKKTYFYAKEKHVRKKWMKFMAQRHNVIVMDINRDLKLSLQKLAEVLKIGRNLIIFPEGTRSHDGRLQKFKKTFAILSRELDIPIVPVSINGAYDALPRGKKFPRPLKRINVKFLNPIYPGDHTYESLRNEVYDRIKGTLS
jgi:long-chain acyl-CoA synthetase